MISYGINSWIKSNDQSWFVPGCTIKGATHREFQRRFDRTKNIQNDHLETLLFGGINGKQSVAGRMIFSDLVCKKPPDLKHFSQIEIDPLTGKTIAGNVYDYTVFPENTSFVGKVYIDGAVNGIERSIALSSVLDIPNLGRGGAKGFGATEIEIIDRNNSIVFISYAWQNEKHMKWVRNLGEELMNENLDVILDQLCPTFKPDVEQQVLNIWMSNSINNSDKIVSVLTPLYKEKAVRGGPDGVGYEFNLLRREKGLVHENLDRYICVMRHGSLQSNLPIELKNNPIFDMRNTINGAFEGLVAAVSI